MNTTNNEYIKADDNKIINKRCIIWVQKIENCLHVCTKSDGCSIQEKNTHTICKTNNDDNYYDSYYQLNQHFN